MQHVFIEYVYLVLIILALIMLANKLRLAYPIVLVLGGLLLSFSGGFSRVAIDPEVIFFIFLPPLLYEAAWQVSWKEFWKWRRVIMSFAFPIVILTSCVIAFVSNALIPGFTLALGFLLGGIISPPDAISATTIMRQVKVPKSLVSIIEGESLLNDASSLIVFRFALLAVLSGTFSLQEATGTFLLVVLVGTLIGLAVALVFYAIHRWLPTTPGIEIVLTLLTPYCMYYFAEHYHFSGVLAVVAGGLFLSGQRERILSYRSRVEGVNVWSNMVFVMNGLVFLLIGLQLPEITKQLGDTSLGTAISYGLIISLALIATRLACTFGASYFTRFISRFIKVADANPGWRMPLIAGWAGMRGVVSLAAALSIPLLNKQGAPFPHRSLILIIVFIVILVTLVFQGLTLPWLIRKVKPEQRRQGMPEHEQERFIRKRLAEVSLAWLNDKHGHDRHANEHIHNLYEKLQIDARFFSRETDEADGDGRSHPVYLALLEQQRAVLHELNRHPDMDEELIRKHLTLIDLEELKLREEQ